MNRSELLRLINNLKIDYKEFTILSSSALVLRNIYDKANDLDIAVTEKGLNELKQNYNLKKKENGFYIVNDKVECILDDMNNKKTKYGKYYIQDINDYMNYLKLSKCEKDKLRISLVQDYINNKTILISNANNIHTTKLGKERIINNLNLNLIDVVDYLKRKILNKDCVIHKKGKNYYCEIEDIIITINSYNYCIITAHKKKC